VTESGNYEQSLKDVKLAIDIHNASGWEMERATQAVRKARQGEVEILKELGIVTKDEAEQLGKIESQSERTRAAVDKLSKTFSGGGEGTAGLEQTIAATNAKLEDTQRILGELIVEVGKSTTEFGEFLGVLDAGEHPVDTLNARLETLLNHAKSGDWEKLAGGLMMVGGAASANPALIMTGASYLGLASSNVRPRTETEAGQKELTNEALAAAGYRGTGNQVGEVPEPTAENMSGGKKKKGGGKRDPGPSGFEGEFGGHTDMTGVAIETQQMEAYKAAQEERTRILAEQEAERQRISDAAWEKDLGRLDEMVKVNKEIADKTAKAQQQQTDALWAGADAATGFAASFIKDEGGKAVILGGMEVAKAIAAGVEGNPVGAIGHAAAAAQFFAVAAQAGRGGGGKKGGPTGGSAAQPRPQPRDDDEARRATAFGAGVGSMGQQRGITVIVNQNSIAKPSPAEARLIGQTVGEEAALHIGRAM
jgi:hypothetical protein